MKTILYTTLYIGLISAAVPAAAYTAVSNSVTTEANTGGGGEAHASVDIHTEVNGEVVTDIHEEETGTDGASASIEKRVQVDTHATESSKAHSEPADKVKRTDTTEDNSAEEAQDISGDMGATTSAAIEIGHPDEKPQTFMVALKTFFTTYVFWWL